MAVTTVTVSSGKGDEMAVIYYSGRDCDGWSNGGAVAFATNGAAYDYMARDLGRAIIEDEDCLIHAGLDGFMVRTEEGHSETRVDYDREWHAEEDAWSSDHYSDFVNVDVMCDCPIKPRCKGHSVSWNGRTDVNLREVMEREAYQMNYNLDTARKPAPTVDELLKLIGGN